MWGQGIATQMLQEALATLKQEECDIACLNVDMTKQAYRVYEKLGFRLMKRPISFENSRGRT
jgi:ribosomal protein S18 acetylase RimI-like enzyme